LSRIAQAFDSWQNRIFASASIRIVAGAALLALAGCGVGGFSLEKAEVDRSIITSNVPSSTSTGADSGFAADQATIRNAVSSVDLEEAAGRPLAWANADTGSRGSITELAESRAKGELCRDFAATRESFDGVALYRGRICMVGAGAWRIDDFRAA
jgi:hypothetical protein